jgi:hypothetical protein
MRGPSSWSSVYGSSWIRQHSFSHLLRTRLFTYTSQHQSSDSRAELATMAWRTRSPPSRPTYGSFYKLVTQNADYHDTNAHALSNSLAQRSRHLPAAFPVPLARVLFGVLGLSFCELPAARYSGRDYCCPSTWFVNGIWFLHPLL